MVTGDGISKMTSLIVWHLGGMAGRAETSLSMRLSLGFFTRQLDPKYAKVKAVRPSQGFNMSHSARPDLKGR